MFPFKEIPQKWVDTVGSLHSQDIKTQKILLQASSMEDLKASFEFRDGKPLCYKSGTVKIRNSTCVCKDDFFGTKCEFPSIAWEACRQLPAHLEDISLRDAPRRIIHGFPFNHEFDFLEARLNILNDSVDVFIIHESGRTSFGEPKSFRFYERLTQEGYLKEFSHKIIYVGSNFFPRLAEKTGWANELSIRYLLGREGFPRIGGMRDDDLFLLTDSDEIPNPDVIEFLKLHDGYPVPIGLNYKWNIFGFFWQHPSKVATIYSIATIGLVRKAYFNNVYFIRNPEMVHNRYTIQNLRSYNDEENPVSLWVWGSAKNYAGFHCSWCFR